jgi:hypothetical protein
MTEYAQRLHNLVQESNDKRDVRTSILARLYANATMSSGQPPQSSKDADIDAIISEFEGDADTSAEVETEFKKLGGRRRKSRKSTKKSKKTRKQRR